MQVRYQLRYSPLMGEISALCTTALARSLHRKPAPEVIPSYVLLSASL